MGTRLLVVDDSVMVRKFLSDLLAEEPTFEVIGTAANGRIALSRVQQLRPEVVILDVEMPVMDGLEALKEIKRVDPKIKVIMFSAFTRAGASVTVDALTLGAEDYVTKPSNMADLAEAREAVGGQLIPKIKAITVGNGWVGEAPAIAPVQPVLARPTVPSLQKVDILAIGTSTGGPNALAELFSQLPENLPVPIVIVQHMPPEFTELLAERLTRESKIPVAEGADGTVLREGRAWIAPGDYHMVLARRLGTVQIQLNQDPPENSCRPAVDVLFRSVEWVYKNRALGVVLTGMGEDGLRGAQAMHRSGAPIIAQDESSSVVWGMAGAVARAGIVDGVFPLHAIAGEIVRRVQVGRTSAYRPDTEVG